MVESRRRTSLRRLAIVACLLALLASGAVPTAAVQAGGATQDPGSSDAALGSQGIDADRTRISIALRPDGDADWRLELRTDLAANGSREAFESLQADVEEDRANVTGRFRERMAGSAAVASDATGRELAIRNVTVTARIDGLADDGVLAYEFEWTNFAAVEGERLHAGDAVDGFFLESGTRLAIRWPADYRATSVQPDPGERTSTHVTWRGSETDFVRGEPRVTVAPDPGDAGDAWMTPAVGLLGVLVLLALGGLAWLVRSGRVALPVVDRSGPSAAGDDRGSRAGSEGDASAAGDADTADGADASSDAEGAGDGGDAGAGGDGGSDDPESAGLESDATESEAAENDELEDDDPESDATDDVPPELLSNEEQVVRLLAANGGRLKQQQVVAELEWTEAKTSQVVTSMHEAERIEKFRIGRENVLALPGAADL